MNKKNQRLNKMIILVVFFLFITISTVPISASPSNSEEAEIGTDPNNHDTDNDPLMDSPDFGENKELYDLHYPQFRLVSLFLK